MIPLMGAIWKYRWKVFSLRSHSHARQRGDLDSLHFAGLHSGKSAVSARPWCPRNTDRANKSEISWYSAW